MTTVKARSHKSPLKIKRVEEKEELKRLTDRLARYIKECRSLDDQNTRLTEELVDLKDNAEENKRSIHRLYQREVNDARSTIDRMTVEHARVIAGVMKYKKEMAQVIAE